MDLRPGAWRSQRLVQSRLALLTKSPIVEHISHLKTGCLASVPDQHRQKPSNFCAVFSIICTSGRLRFF